MCVLWRAGGLTSLPIRLPDLQKGKARVDLFQRCSILNPSFHSVDSLDRFSFIMSSLHSILISILARVFLFFFTRADLLSYHVIKIIGASVSEPHTCHVNAIFSVCLSVPYVLPNLNINSRITINSHVRKTATPTTFTCCVLRRYVHNRLDLLKLYSACYHLCAIVPMCSLTLAPQCAAFT